MKMQGETKKNIMLLQFVYIETSLSAGEAPLS
jgi:hypothetical protein